MSLILSAEEIQQLTGYSQPARQLAELHRRGFVRARQDRFGRVVLERAHFEAVRAGTYHRPGFEPAAPTPDLVSSEWRPWTSEALAPGEWMRRNWSLFLTTPADCREHLVAPVALPDISGVYFLFHRGSLVYVGETTSTKRRLEQHAEDKRFDCAHAFRAPEFFRRDIERAYITALDPPLNLKIQPPGPLFSAMITAIRAAWAGHLPYFST